MCRATSPLAWSWPRQLPPQPWIPGCAASAARALLGGLLVAGQPLDLLDRARLPPETGGDIAGRRPALPPLQDPSLDGTERAGLAAVTAAGHPGERKHPVDEVRTP